MKLKLKGHAESSTRSVKFDFDDDVTIYEFMENVTLMLIAAHFHEDTIMDGYRHEIDRRKGEGDGG